MKVKELIKELIELNPDLEVCLIKKGGHGEPEFPEYIKELKVETKQFYTGEKKEILFLK